MFEYIQRNWVGVLLVVGVLAMHLGGHRHGGHGQLTHGCGGHDGQGGHEQDGQRQRHAGASVSRPGSGRPVPSQTDWGQEAYSPGSPPESYRHNGSGPRQPSNHRHG